MVFAYHHNQYTGFVATHTIFQVPPPLNSKNIWNTPFNYISLSMTKQNPYGLEKA